MKKSNLVVALVIVIIVAGAGAYYLVSPSGGTSTTSTPAGGTSGMGVQVASDNVTVFTALATGTWQISLRNTGTVPVSTITVYLQTPTRAFICTGPAPSDGLFFKNCPATSGNPLPPNSTVSGRSTGAGPASATPGTQYTVAAHVAFTNGQTTWVNSTVTARSG